MHGYGRGWPATSHCLCIEKHIFQCRNNDTKMTQTSVGIKSVNKMTETRDQIVGIGVCNHYIQLGR